MSDAPTYYFILPDIDRPIGGVNVLLHYIDMLNAAGYRAAPLYGSAHQSYKFAPCSARSFYSDALRATTRKSMGRRAKLAALPADLVVLGQNPVNAPLQRKPSDVYIIPEYLYPELFDLFPEARRILAVQDVFGFFRSFTRDTARERPAIGRFDAIFTTSEASHRAVQSVVEGAPYRLTLSVERPGLHYRQDKKLQIAYMPRKRKDDAKIIVNALKNRADMADVTFLAIENVAEDALQSILGESLMSRSGGSQEGFGLPPAEALSAGCLVVGYTGVGGDEYFTSDVAFPIQDSDLVTFIETVRAVIGEYKADPTRLDRMRKAASAQILEKYNAAQAETNLLTAWAGIHQQLTGCTTGSA